MRIINLSKIISLISAALLGFSFSFSANAFAKDVNLYDQPSISAKVVGTLAQSSKMVPIFTNKTGDWMKVGDPTNGNVGWVKVSDFNNAGNPQGTAEGFSMSQQTVATPNGPQTYRTIQFQPAQNDAQAAFAIKQIQAQQMNAIQNYQKMFNAAYEQMNELYKTNPQAFGSFPPVVMPIIVMPQPTPVRQLPAK